MLKDCDLNTALNLLELLDISLESSVRVWTLCRKEEVTYISERYTGIDFAVSEFCRVKSQDLDESCGAVGLIAAIMPKIWSMLHSCSNIPLGRIHVSSPHGMNSSSPNPYNGYRPQVCCFGHLPSIWVSPTDYRIQVALDGLSFNVTF